MCLIVKFHGLGVDAYDRHTWGRAPQAEVLTPGYKYNLTDINEFKDQTR